MYTNISIRGKDYQINIKKSTRVEEIRQWIAGKYKTCKKNIKIFHGGARLCDSYTFQNYNIKVHKLHVSINRNCRHCDFLEPQGMGSLDLTNHCETISKNLELLNEVLTENNTSQTHGNFKKKSDGDGIVADAEEKSSNVGTMSDIILTAKAKSRNHSSCIDRKKGDDVKKSNQSPPKKRKNQQSPFVTSKISRKSVIISGNFASTAGCSKTSDLQMKEYCEKSTVEDQTDNTTEAEVLVKPLKMNIESAPKKNVSVLNSYALENEEIKRILQDNEITTHEIHTIVEKIDEDFDNTIKPFPRSIVQKSLEEVSKLKLRILTDQTFQSLVSGLNCKLFAIRQPNGNTSKVSTGMMTFQPDTGRIKLNHDNFSTSVSPHEIFIPKSSKKIKLEVNDLVVALIDAHKRLHVAEIMKFNNSENIEVKLFCGDLKIVEPILIDLKSIKKVLQCSLFDFLSAVTYRAS